MSTKKNTARQLLRDPDTFPTNAVLASALAASYPAYEKLVGSLPQLGIEPQWRFYPDGKAWLCKCLHKWQTTRGTDKEKTIFWLSAWEGFFKISFFVSEKHRLELLALPLSADTIALINAAKTIGKLKFFPLIFDVGTGDLPADLAALIDFQKSAK